MIDNSFSKINTYDTQDFSSKFMPAKQELAKLLKDNFEKFFIVKVEDMFKLIKLPVLPSRSTITTCIYLTDGEAIMTIGNKRYKIFKDEMLIVPVGQVFSFDNPDINTGYLFSFHNDILIGKFANVELIKEFDFLKIWANSCIKLNKESSEDILFLLKRLFREYIQNGIKNLYIIQPYLTILLCEINKAYNPTPDIKVNSALDITKKFKELLFTHFRTKHLVSDYASLLCISPNHLNKSVKKITGTSPTKLIDEALVLEAKVLLYQTSLSISDIAFEIGIYDQSYFSRLFKKYESVTPLEFRKRIEKS